MARVLPIGGSVTGTYLGTDRVAAVLRVRVATDDGVYAVPVSGRPAARVGAAVDVLRTAAGTSVEPSAGRATARGADRGRDELEAGR